MGTFHAYFIHQYGYDDILTIDTVSIGHNWQLQGPKRWLHLKHSMRSNYWEHSKDGPLGEVNIDDRMRLGRVQRCFSSNKKFKQRLNVQRQWLLKSKLFVLFQPGYRFEDAEDRAFFFSLTISTSLETTCLKSGIPNTYLHARFRSALCDWNTWQLTRLKFQFYRNVITNGLRWIMNKNIKLKHFWFRNYLTI